MITQREKIETKSGQHQSWRKMLYKLMAWLGGIAFGLVFTLSGWVVLRVLAEVKVLTCTRLEPAQYECALQSTLFGVVPLSSTPIEGLQGARVKPVESGTTYTDSQGFTQIRPIMTYGVILVTAGGEVDLDTVWSSGRESKEQTAVRINDFVDNSETRSLRVHSNLRRLFISWMSLIFLAPGLIALAVTIENSIRFLLKMARLTLSRV